MERKCITCNKSKPLTKEFFKQIHNKYFYKECRLCQKSKQNEYMKKRRRNKDKINTCEYCKNNKLTNSRFCEEHYYKTFSRIHLGDSNRWLDLKELLIKQNYKCPYTGDKIIIGYNSNIDHKFPYSRFPDLKNNINNLQWTTRKANIAKNNMTDNEYKIFIKKQYEYIRSE